MSRLPHELPQPPHKDPSPKAPEHKDPEHKDPSPHAELYHATLHKFVDSIRTHVKLDLAHPRTDFSREPHAFYLMDDLHKAKTVMAEEVAGFTHGPTAIMVFSLNLEGLKVKTFSREKEGAALQEWREFVKYNRERRKINEPAPPIHPIFAEGYDVVIGWMSTFIQGQYQPISSEIWQYAILTQKGVNALKLERVEL